MQKKKTISLFFFWAVAVLGPRTGSITCFHCVYIVVGELEAIINCSGAASDKSCRDKTSGLLEIVDFRLLKREELIGDNMRREKGRSVTNVL